MSCRLVSPAKKYFTFFIHKFSISLPYSWFFCNSQKARFASTTNRLQVTHPLSKNKSTKFSFFYKIKLTFELYLPQKNIFYITILI